MALHSLSLKGEDHVICIEISRGREVLVLVEAYSLAQVEGVGEPISGGFPALCQSRNDVCGTDFEFSQSVVDGMRRGIKGGSGSIKRRVKALWGTFGTVNQRLCLDRARKECAQHQAGRQF